MSEPERRNSESLLVTERGNTTIHDKVVSKIAGMAAREVDGVHMGGSASRTAGGVLGSVTGSESQTRGVSVEVGTTEVAIDLTLGIDYGKNILETVEEVRRGISERVQSITGLRVTEMNATINDIVFPDEGERGGARSDASARPGPRTMPRRELRPGARERDVTEMETTPREHTDAEGKTVPPEARVERAPLRQDEISRLSSEDDETTEIERSPSEENDRRRRGRREES